MIACGGAALNAIFTGSIREPRASFRRVQPGGRFRRRGERAAQRGADRAFQPRHVRIGPRQSGFERRLPGLDSRPFVASSAARMASCPASSRSMRSFMRESDQTNSATISAASASVCPVSLPIFMAVSRSGRRGRRRVAPA